MFVNRLYGIQLYTKTGQNLVSIRRILIDFKYLSIDVTYEQTFYWLIDFAAKPLFNVVQVLFREAFTTTIILLYVSYIILQP